ncbi:2Fe-2S iron-sulfur cluster-binding protein [Vibrio sp. F74]|uniref:2Fe-2S iron-sulfur cluster-binding protein n=1 Tax=Vibrio sp. F74 TaxID=700020 RepID=UPI0035F5E2D7
MLAWQHTDSVDLICKDKWSETPDTVSFSLGSIDDDITFDFKPGQFVTLGFSLVESVEYRAYSISSLPKKNELQFTVKRVKAGKVSNYINDTLVVGDKVTVLKPAGSFNSVDCLPQSKVVMLSAGCGITPVTSMVKQWLSENADLDIDFIHQAKNKENTIYFAELEALANAHQNFHLKLLLKDNEGTDYHQGRFDQEWLERLCPDLHQRSAYLCGPVGFMQDTKSYLEALSFDMTNFFEESFSPEQKMCDIDQKNGVEQSEVVSVSVPSFGVEVDAEYGTMLIDSLEKAGVPVIAACRSGMCGSCKCKVKVGEVERTSVETLTTEEIEKGFVLACSCIIKSDVEVSLN